MSPTEVSLEGLVRVIIDWRFRVYSGQARAANLAETVIDAAPACLLCRPIGCYESFLSVKSCFVYVLITLAAKLVRCQNNFEIKNERYVRDFRRALSLYFASF